MSLVRRKVQTGALLANTSLGELAESGVRALKALVVKRHEPWSLFVCRGCRGRCTYCAIRRSIGGVKSKPIPTVLEEFREGVRQGFRDFAILGDDPGCYGVDIGESLPRLLKDLASACEEPEVKAAIDNAAVFRLKEVHPKFVVAYDGALTDPRWFGRMKSMLCPVQSGNARVLEMMEREHAPDDLLRVLRRAKRANPQVSLDTQVIVGFPSETEEEFGDTLRMVRDAGFSSVVVFPYHDKEGAAAAELEPKVPQPVVKRRMADAFRFFKKEGIQATYSCP